MSQIEAMQQKLAGGALEDHRLSRRRPRLLRGLSAELRESRRGSVVASGLGVAEGARRLSACREFPLRIAPASGMGGAPGSPPARIPGSRSMTLSSMTGFARAQGAAGPWRWTVEIKCVNAKGLDLRLRVPAGFDRIEAPARARLGKALSARHRVRHDLGAARERRRHGAHRLRAARRAGRRGAGGRRAVRASRRRRSTGCSPCAASSRPARPPKTRRRRPRRRSDAGEPRRGGRRGGRGAPRRGRGAGPGARRAARRHRGADRRPPTTIRRASPRRCAQGSPRRSRR